MFKTQHAASYRPTYAQSKQIQQELQVAWRVVNAVAVLNRVEHDDMPNVDHVVAHHLRDPQPLAQGHSLAPSRLPDFIYICVDDPGGLRK